MRKDIHPAYFKQATVRCACGRVFTVGSTKEKMTVEICSNCHPFYTGQEKLIDTAGRIEKFKARVKKAESTPVKNKKSRKKSAAPKNKSTA